MDQLAACSGFMYSMITAKQYVQSGDYKNILVVGADKLSKITDLTIVQQQSFLVMALVQ